MVFRVDNQIISVQKQNQIPQTAEEKKLMKTCTEFEAVMVQKMLEVMQGSTKMFGEGFGGDYFQSMFQAEMAKQISQNDRGIGLAKILYQQLNQPKVTINSQK